MISLKRFLDESRGDTFERPASGANGIFPLLLAAYRAALREMGNSSVEACPAMGEDLKRNLGKVGESLGLEPTADHIEEAGLKVQDLLQDWGKRTAQHYLEKSEEVKGILMVMARTAESVGERDQRCALQINNVTGRLEKIASLEDLTQIRSSIVASASELKTSIDRMTAEGKQAVDQLRAEVAVYQKKLEEAEKLASSDTLTGLKTRLWVERHLEWRFATSTPFCVLIIDIDAFKSVNDAHGHGVGDELLQQFSSELKSACRMTDVVGRWGGDEFIVLWECNLDEAKSQIIRLRDWICGNYKLRGQSGPLKIHIDASIGVAERLPGESIKSLLSRADRAMYEEKAESRAALARAR
jgi:diguanylate cyclase (GGDEF)-like protein